MLFYTRSKINYVLFTKLTKVSKYLVIEMSTFISKVSPITGKTEWTVQDENYDYHQEIARSAYADMLHDTERNQKYYEGLKAAIKLIHQRGQSANVLDIGTGSGLLSMMAVRCGADTVTTCEAFRPMAECAKHVIADNTYADKIKLIFKRSTEVTVGPDGDMPQRANILVTEVYDTELIGEGSIGTFHHAHENLLTKDCIVVPTAANMYAQIVSSDFVKRWNQFQPISLGESGSITVPDSVCKCPGAAAVHDLQMDQISQEWFKPLTDPIQVFRFDNSGKTPIEFKGQSINELKAKASGSCDAIFMWWDAEMDTENKVLLSCAPRWAHPEPNNMPWRDHWMQAVYYPSQRVTVNEGENVVLHSIHDDYSLWFDVHKQNSAESTVLNGLPDPPACRCGAHVACSRSRLGMLNDCERNEKYLKALKNVITSDTRCLCLSDASLLPIMAAKLGAKHVYTLETHSSSKSLVQAFAKENNVESSITILQKSPDSVQWQDLNIEKIDIVIGEPFFFTTVAPWHNIYFWYARTALTPHLSPNAKIMPSKAVMKAVAVDFKDLWKIRAPVGNCEGFDLTYFDKMIEKSSEISDDNVEAQPLWEYPGKPLSEQFGLMTFDFSKPLAGIKTIERKGILELTNSGMCNGVAVWMDYYLDPDTCITTGLLDPPKEGVNLKWDPHTRQGVHLFKKPIKIDVEREKSKLKYRVVFKPSTGDFDFEFSLVT